MVGYLLIGSINRKYIVKPRPFSLAKITEKKDYIKPTKSDFDPNLYIIHIGTNDVSQEDSPKTILEQEIETTEYLKTETSIVIVSNIIARGDKFKEKGERLCSFQPSILLKKKFRRRYSQEPPFHRIRRAATSEHLRIMQLLPRILPSHKCFYD